MGKLEEIISGWKNYVFKNPAMEEIAKQRVRKCLECDKLKKNYTCRICGCYIPAKTRSERSKCPEKKW